MRFLKVLLLLALFICGLLFFIQNGQELGLVQDGQNMGKSLTLQLDLYLKELKWQSSAVPLYAVILCTFGVGMLFATLLLLVDRIRLGCSLMGQRRAMRSLEREVERLRSELAKETKLIAAKSAEVKELPQAAASS